VIKGDWSECPRAANRPPPPPPPPPPFTPSRPVWCCVQAATRATLLEVTQRLAAATAERIDSERAKAEQQELRAAAAAAHEQELAALRVQQQALDAALSESKRALQQAREAELLLRPSIDAQLSALLDKVARLDGQLSARPAQEREREHAARLAAVRAASAAGGGGGGGLPRLEMLCGTLSRWLDEAAGSAASVAARHEAEMAQQRGWLQEVREELTAALAAPGSSAAAARHALDAAPPPRDARDGDAERLLALERSRVRT
jgi:hypothetical protein